jgi:hypothetical protein
MGIRIRQLNQTPDFIVRLISISKKNAFSIVFSKKRQKQGFRRFENQGVYSCK